MLAGDIESRELLSTCVRQSCEQIYRSAITDDMWSRWRKWASQYGLGNCFRRKYLTYAQSRFLIAIAIIRRDQGESDRRKQVKAWQVRDLLGDPLFIHASKEALHECDRLGYVSGRDAIEVYGLCESNLRRHIQKFSRLTLYDIEFLQSAIA